LVLIEEDLEEIPTNSPYYFLQRRMESKYGKPITARGISGASTLTIFQQEKEQRFLER
jgi:hypothetical protein